MTYEFLTADTIGEYIAVHPTLASRVDVGAITEIDEVGDGNLNLVFIVHDAHGGGVVLKQALPYVRLVGPDWPMTPDRARHEAEALQLHGSLAPALVPEVYLFDADRYILGMEDLSDHRVWRGALNDGLRHEGVAAMMGEYVASVAFGTSIFGLDPEEQKMIAARSANPELCTITEDLVFTEPYFENGRNSVIVANEKDAAALAADDVMVRAMGNAKWAFMTHGEALIHADLHTGSVMVRAASGDEGPVDSAKAFDSEFAFYGPVAFDLGALWANYTIAAARATALGDDDRAEWCMNLCDQTWSSFEESFRSAWPSRRDARVFTDGFGDDLVERWREETWLFAAAKMARRIVGLAKAKDIESLPEELREGAARGVLETARAAVRLRVVSSESSLYVSSAMKILRATTTR
jgi:5-methylthioribose kinase